MVWSLGPTALEYESLEPMGSRAPGSVDPSSASHAAHRPAPWRGLGFRVALGFGSGFLGLGFSA